MKAFLAGVAILACAAAVQAEYNGGNVAAGKATFAAACASCHQVGPHARNALGPPLNGILDRRVGADPSFKYSPAMAGARFTWTEEKLAAFIKKPSQVVPGTKMRFFGLGYDERRLANLFAYLRTLPAAP